MDNAATEKPETDVDLPRALIKRIVNTKLAALTGDESKNFGISKDALTALSESTKVFISLIASTANDICQEKRRSTVNADDVFNALQDLDFPELVGPLREQLEAFKEAVKERNKNRPSKKRRNPIDAQQAAIPRGTKHQQHLHQQHLHQQHLHQQNNHAASAVPSDVADVEADVGILGGGPHDPDEIHPDTDVGLDADVAADVLGGPGDDDALVGLGMGLGLGLSDGDVTGLGDATEVDVEEMLVDAPP